ncbi:hypothetical protein BDR07DRAFT_1436907 [Suillus spraguei]|nr:hypothetical protein BDR07DRAFT_1436907 [Suillus spraguei]
MESRDCRITDKGNIHPQSRCHQKRRHIRSGRQMVQGPCFVSVTDRFLCELEPVTKGQVAKDLDTKYKHLVKGLCHVQLRVRSCPLYFLYGRQRHLRREPSFWNYQPSLSQMRMVFGSRSLLPIR